MAIDIVSIFPLVEDFTKKNAFTAVVVFDDTAGNIKIRFTTEDRIKALFNTDFNSLIKKFLNLSKEGNDRMAFISEKFLRDSADYEIDLSKNKIIFFPDEYFCIDCPKLPRDILVKVLKEQYENVIKIYNELSDAEKLKLELG